MAGRAEKKYVDVDVICQHTTKGEILPIRIRMADENGELHVYNVHQYRERSIGGAKYRMPNEVWASNHLRRFECKINVFSVEKTIELFYNGYEGKWQVAY